MQQKINSSVGGGAQTRDNTESPLFDKNFAIQKENQKPIFLRLKVQRTANSSLHRFPRLISDRRATPRGHGGRTDRIKTNSKDVLL